MNCKTQKVKTSEQEIKGHVLASWLKLILFHNINLINMIKMFIYQYSLLCCANLAYKLSFLINMIV